MHPCTARVVVRINLRNLDSILPMVFIVFDFYSPFLFNPPWSGEVAVEP